MPIARLVREQTVLLVVDMQQKLLPLIDQHERITEQVAKLIRGCAGLEVPIVVTEQYPAGLGPTVDAIASVLPMGDPGAPKFTKVKFSACIEAMRTHLSALGRSTVLICGIESHICVMQTVLDVMGMGLVAAVAGDAVSSRQASDHQLAMRRISEAGAMTVSVEMALMEMVKEAGTDRFKAILPIIR
ncbi:isochorismatase family protein [Planctomycetales bacterium ZRK34]|nr:isochorismatase family protein [Planctomycetales bacterium ZRK34]